MARALVYLKPPNQEESAYDVRPRLDFIVRQPLVINISDKLISMVWKMVGGILTFVNYKADFMRIGSQTPKSSPVTPRKKSKLKSSLKSSPKMSKPQSPPQPQTSPQQQQQSGWISWAWGMVVDDQQNAYAKFKAFSG